MGSMSRNMKSFTALLNLLHYFYHGIQCAKTRNYVHGEAYEVKYEICRFKMWNLHTESVNSQFASNFRNITKAKFLMIVYFL